MGHRRGTEYQVKKWQRFTQRYGMSVVEFRALKKSDPAKAHQIRMQVEQNFHKAAPIAKTRNH